MKTLVLAALAAALIISSNTASATPLAGDAKFLDPANQSVATIPITGDLDTANSSMTVDPFIFLGLQWFTQSVELLGTGTFTRPDGFGGSISATVNPGQLGAYMTFEWGINVIPNFMIWDVNSSANGSSYTTADSDGDGIPGHAFVVGPFVGFSILYDFIVGDPPPGISVSIGIEGGTTQECSEAGGSIVSLSATIDVVGGAEPGSVEWFVDGESSGTGETATPFLALGPHTVEALASSTTGETGTDSITVLVQDTTPPDLDVAFIDRAGEPITTAGAGTRVTTRILPSDICDPDPVAEGTVSPVFAVNDGDLIKVQSEKIKDLPTTAIELSASTTDASGNSNSGMAVLSITD